MWPFNRGYKLEQLPPDMREALTHSGNYGLISMYEPLLCHRDGGGKQYTFSICSSRDQGHMLAEGRKNTREPEKESIDSFVFGFYTSWKEKPAMPKKKK